MSFGCIIFGNILVILVSVILAWRCTYDEDWVKLIFYSFVSVPIGLLFLSLGLSDSDLVILNVYMTVMAWAGYILTAGVICMFLYKKANELDTPKSKAKSC